MNKKFSTLLAGVALLSAMSANGGTVFETGKDSGNRITINKNNSAVNTDVHWDKDYKTNVGIDAQFLIWRHIRGG